MRYNKIILLTIITSFALMQNTTTETGPATNSETESNTVEKKVESIKNLLINPCEGLNEEDCTKTEGCEFNTEDKVCSQSEVVSGTQTDDTDGSTPIEFKEEYLVSINLGTSIPFGTNLRNQFTPGPNIQLNFLTPFGMSLGDNEIKVSGTVNIINCVAKSSEYTDYSVMSFGADAKMFFGAANIVLSTGLATSSGTAMYTVDGAHPEYSMTTAFVSVGGAYTLPLSPVFENLSESVKGIENVEVSVHFKAIEIFGAPTPGGQTSDLISFGISIGYPLLF